MSTLSASASPVQYPDVFDGIPIAKVKACALYHERLNGDDPNVTTEAFISSGAFDATLEVWASDPSLFQEDLDAFVSAMANAQASPAPSAVPSAATVVPIAASPDLPEKILSKHEAAVSDIVGMIVQGYEDEGSRNFRIGKRTYAHLRYQRRNFPKYTPKDCDNTVNRITDEVRILVAIEPSSIRLMDWVKCHVLRDLVATAKGADHADRLSFHEYRRLIGKALTFDKKDVVGKMNDGWLDYIMQVSTSREAGETITTQAFIDGMDAHAIAYAASKAPAKTPEQQAIADAAKAQAKRDGDVRKALANIDLDVQDALGEKRVPFADVLATVEKAAGLHGHAMPSLEVTVGPITITDLNRIIDSMFANSQYAEALHARNRLDSLINSLNSARASMMPAPQSVVAPQSAELIAA